MKIMNVMIFLVLVFWIFLFAISPFLIFKKKTNSSPRRINKDIPLGSVQTALRILEENPDLESYILEILAYEKNPGDNKLSTKAAILRAKLKIHIRNPVVRIAMIEIVKNKK